MAKIIAFLMIALLFLTLSLGFFSGLYIFGASVNLIILILTASFMVKAEREGLIVSIFLAFFYDFYLGSYFGLAVISVLVLYSLLTLLKNKIAYEPGYILFLLAVFFSSLFFDLVVLGGMAVHDQLNFYNIFLFHILPNALLNLIFAIPFLIIARRLVRLLTLYRLMGKEENKIRLGF